MKHRIALAALVLAAALLVPVVAGATQPAPGQVRGAFFTNWSRYARGYTVKQIPVAKLNVIDYAFAFISSSGQCQLSDSWSDYQAPTWSGSGAAHRVARHPANPNQHPFGNFY